MVQSSTCTFTNARDQELSGRLERPDGPVRATAVFAHCFTCSKDLRGARRLARALAERGVAVLSFDFTGLGSSEGDFAATTFSSDVDDLVAAAGYLGDVLAPPALLVGHSVGGAATLVAATRLDHVRGVATIGAPADLDHLTRLLADDLDTIHAHGEAEVTLAGRRFTIRSEFVDDLAAHRVTDAARDLDAALLVLHSPDDQVVDIDHAARLFRAADHPRSFVSLDGADHLLSSEADARYAAEVIAAWASRYVGDLPMPADTVDTTSPAPMPRGTGTYDDRGAVATTTDSYRTRVTTRGFLLQADEPTSVGGGETGPTPYDYLAAALASCTSMTLRMYADRKELPLDEVETRVDFDRVHAEDCQGCEHHDGRIELFTRSVTLHGDLDDAARDRLLSIANRCPVHRTLEGQIHVRTELT